MSTDDWSEIPDETPPAARRIRRERVARSPLAVAIIASIVTVIAGEVMTGMQGIAAFLYEHITIGWKR